eukprot:g9458.t1
MQAPDEGCQSLADALEARDFPKVVHCVGILIRRLHEGDTEVLQAALPTLKPLLENLPEVDFEGRKDIVALFTSIAKTQVGGSSASNQLDYTQTMQQTPTAFEEFAISSDLIALIASRYAELPDLSLNYGIVLRDLCRLPHITCHALDSKILYVLFRIARKSENFDLASDAFLSIKDILTRQKQLAAGWILNNLDEYFQHYHAILLDGRSTAVTTTSAETREEDLYICQRQSLKLLSDMLLDRVFMQIMLKYINNDEYLKTHMTFLRSSSKTIQFEAFHVFKIFAANPNKKPRVTRILYQNREKLIEFLETFLIPERQADTQFLQDKATVVEKLRRLQLPEEGNSNRAEGPAAGAPAAPGGAAVGAQ